MEAIVAAGNTYDPCLLTLRRLGYELWIERGEERTLWLARKDGPELLAYSPPELLGLAVMWEELGEQWSTDVPDIMGELRDALTRSEGSER